jgi:hypothetical protein
MQTQNAADDAGWGAAMRLRVRFPTFLSDVLARPRGLLLFVFGRLMPARRLAAALASRAARRHGARLQFAAFGGSLASLPEVADVVAGLRHEGICAGLRLTPAATAEILDHASRAACGGGEGWRTIFTLPGHADAERRTGQRILCANVWAADRECPAVARLVRDPWLHAVAAGYLGPAARVIDVRLLWSFPARGAARPELSRVAQDTFHFDLADWGQLKFFFYITDVDAETGAHVFVRGSHARRPLSHQLTAFVAKSYAEIIATYGREAVQVIDGRAGTGFVEDPFGFHTGAALRRGRRLMLEVSFGITAPPHGGGGDAQG